ncbi:TIR domain-containing protein [bacterium]|nr:TIR domain-containing protein [bacterium]
MSPIALDPPAPIAPPAASPAVANRRVFISFSHHDDPLFRALYEGFRAQGFEPYSYQIRGHEIPPGADVRAALHVRIAAAGLVVCLLTEHGLQSPWVAFETATAITLRGPDLVVVPVVPDGFGGRHPRFVQCDDKAVADRVFDLAFHAVDLTDPAGVLRKLLELLNLPYTPPGGGRDVELFFDRITAELPTLAYRDPGDAVGVMRRAADRVRECRAAVDRGDFPDALRVAARADDSLVDDTADRVGCYNLGLVRVSLEVRYGSGTPAGRARRVEEVLTRLLKHNRADEVVHQGLGYLALDRGDWADARKRYAEAYRINPAEPDAAHGLALAMLRAGDPLPPELLHALRANVRHTTESLGVLVLAYARAGDHAGVADILKQAHEAPNDPALLSATLVAAFESAAPGPTADVEWVRRVARACRGASHEEETLASLGVLAARAGDLVVARRCFGRLRRLAPRNVHHLGRYLQLCQVTGRHSATQVLADRILSLPAGGKQDPDRRYYRGMAYWVLGLRAKAEDEFRRSGAAAADHYSRVVGELPLVGM